MLEPAIVDAYIEVLESELLLATGCTEPIALAYGAALLLGINAIYRSDMVGLQKAVDYLENKANFGVRLREAYLAGDREVLQKMAQECDVAREKLAALRLCHRKMWHQIYKPIGWDAQDIRYGAMLARFDSVKWRILSYLNGEVDRLDELEEKRLRFDAAPDDAPRFVEQFFWKRFLSVATASTLQY